MRLTLLRSAVALLTFSIGIAISGIWLYGYREHKTKKASPPLSQDAPPLPTPAPATTPIDLDDYYGYIREASVTCEDFPSPSSSNRALSEQVKDADGSFTRIVKRGAKINVTGQRVGRRVITWSCCGVEGQSAAHIYWTDGAEFCDIIAATVKEALEFEKKNN
jgi:hypothetical protein